MEFIADRQLRNEPGKVRKRLEDQGEVVLTSRGKPYALMLHVEPDKVDDALALASRIKAQMAVSAMRAHAAEKGLDRMTMEETDAEIEAARRERRAGAQD